MAYDTTKLHLIKGGVLNEWVYDTEDPINTVTGASYFSNAITKTKSTPGRGMNYGDRVMVRIFSDIEDASTITDLHECVVTTLNASTGAGTIVEKGAAFPSTATIGLAASGTTDGMTITITMKDANGNTLAETVGFEWWISEAATGIGLTADSYSGTVTASVGGDVAAFTAKKHFSSLTAATGIYTATAVDSANPADQYVAVRLPNGKIVVSEASGTNWEGA